MESKEAQETVSRSTLIALLETKLTLLEIKNFKSPGHNQKMKKSNCINKENWPTSPLMGQDDTMGLLV